MRACSDYDYLLQFGDSCSIGTTGYWYFEHATHYEDSVICAIIIQLLQTLVSRMVILILT